MKFKCIALIGPMASGKSTIGQLLSQASNLPFFDTDAVVSTQCQQSIGEIFAQHGEAYFRQQETLVLTKLLPRTNLVLATGGGIVLAESNRNLLKQHCWIVYLKTTIACQLQRIAADNARPLLQVANKQNTLIELQTAREPLYNALADFIIEVSTLKPQQICEEILLHYQNTIGTCR